MRARERMTYRFAIISRFWPSARRLRHSMGLARLVHVHRAWVTRPGEIRISSRLHSRHEPIYYLLVNAKLCLPVRRGSIRRP